MNRRSIPLLFGFVFLFVSPYSERARAATQHLTACDEASLRAAISQGGEILFDCAGVIVLTNTLVITNDVTLDANGRAVTLSGGGMVRLFTVNSNASLRLSGLHLIRGRATNAGGAVLNWGSFRAANCRFSVNVASPQPAGYGQAQGGALWNNGVATLERCVFLWNSAIAALHNTGPAGTSQGGAVFNSGFLAASEIVFDSNNAVGANGPSRTYNFTTPRHGGPAHGGAVYNGRNIYDFYSDHRGTSIVLNSTFAFNSCTGGDGGNGFIASFEDQNGGHGAAGMGGGIFNEGILATTNSTWHGNTSTGGRRGAGWFPGRDGTNGVGLGGGVAHVGGSSALAFCTLAANTATNGGAVHSTTNSVFLTHTILYHSPPNNNCAGPVIDSGYNLSSDAPAGFTAPGTISNIDPLLGPLGSNGGPTLTMALLPGSPAINAGSERSCPPNDQRGIARPAHDRCDIGAYELVLNDFRFSSITKGQEGAKLRGYGPPGSSFSIQGSSQLEHWDHLSDAVVQHNGLFDMLVPAEETHQFFRVARPGPGSVALP